MKRLALTLAISIPAILLIGCPQAATQTPAPPNSTQTALLNADRTMADAINAAVKTAIALRDQGRLPQTTVLLIENWAASAARVDDAIATELESSDPWTTQKSKILLMLPAFKFPAMSGIDPTLQVVITQIMTLASMIEQQVTTQ